MNQDHVDHGMVEKLAYQLWQERGSPLGSPEQDWLRAEEQLRSENSLGDPPLSAVAMEASET
jgi:LmbE family N-acetylglucosaminyl deacetylase